MMMSQHEKDDALLTKEEGKRCGKAGVPERDDASLLFCVMWYEKYYKFRANRVFLLKMYTCSFLNIRQRTPPPSAVRLSLYVYIYARPIRTADCRA